MTSSGTADEKLEGLANQFAAELNDTIERSLMVRQRFRSSVAGNKFFVTSHEPENELTSAPLLLSLDDNPIITVEVKYWCIWDRPRQYLATEESNFVVRVHGVDNPLFHVDYIRDPTAKVPVSHVQVHAHRDEFVHLMTRSKRVTKTDDLGLAAISRFHFPMGGHRFRPCLEDLLEVLINEFNVDRPDTWRTALAEGRQRWRAIQLKSAVRDAPEETISALAGLGYEVHRPQELASRRVSARFYSL